MQQTIKIATKEEAKGILHKISFINLDKKILLFISVFLIMTLSIGNSWVLLIIPFLGLGYLFSFTYLLISLVSGLTSVIIFAPNNVYLYILLCLSFLLITIFMRIFKLSIYNRIYLSVFLSEIVSRYTYEYIQTSVITIFPLIMAFISLLAIYGLANLSSINEYKNNKVYPYRAAACITMICVFCAISLNYHIVDISITWILVTFALLLIAIIFDFTYAPTLIVLTALAYYVFIGATLSEISLLVIPPLFANVIGRKGKYQALVIYLLITIALLFYNYQTLSVKNAIEYSVIIICLSFTPSTLINEIKKKIYNPTYQYQVYENKMREVEQDLKEELNHISNLFEIVSLQYQSEEESKRNRKQTDQIYRSLCINCPKNKLCYQNSDVQLVKLFFKSIDGELTSEEENMVNSECMKPSRFFSLAKEFKNDFYREYKYNAEYQELKKALSKQVLGFKELIDNYKVKLNIENKLIANYESKIIRDVLEQNKFDVIYVNYEKNLNNEIVINLGIKAFNEQEIMTKALSSIEEVLDLNLKVSRIYLTSVEGFYKVEIVPKHDYQILHGVHQLHKDNDASGDSYISFNNSKYNIYAISDGMGSGNEARNESRTTIKLLKGMIETGMDLNYGIGMINSLLKIKNRYDNYATLDILSINNRDLKANFTKNGASHSYIYRDNKLTCIDITSLPVGIVEDIDAYDFQYKLQKDDIIIMFSDGVSCNGEQLNQYIRNIISYHPQVMAREIATKFSAKSLKDDTTVMIVKILQSQ